MSAPLLLFSVNAHNDAASVGQTVSSATLSSAGFVSGPATCVGIAGLPSVASDAFGSPFYSFSASDGQYMIMPDLSTDWAFDQGGFTAIGVVNFMDAQSAGGALFEFGFTADPDVGTFGTDMISLTRSGADGLGNAARIQINDGSGGPSVLGIPDLANLFAAATSASGAPHLIAVRVSNDVSQSGHARVDYYADGFKIGTTVADGPMASLPPTPVATVGGWPASGSEFCDVGVYQLDVYNGALSDADLASAFAAMRAEWSASLAAPAPVALGPLSATVAFATSPQSFALADYFSDPRGSLLTYFVASDPFPSGSGVASLSQDGQSLVLAWAGLDDADTAGALVVAASNASQGVASTFAVTVAAVQPPALTTGIGAGSNIRYSTAYGTAPIDVALSTLFSDPQGEPLTYYLSDDGAAPGVAALTPDGKDLVVAWRYLGANDVPTDLVVSASNAFAGARQQIGVTVSGAQPPATSGPAPSATVSFASMPAATVALTPYIYDPQGAPLTFYLVSSPFSTVFVSADGQGLDVNWQALGASDTTSNVTVAASNAFVGIQRDISVTVAAVAAPAVTSAIPDVEVSSQSPTATVSLNSYFYDNEMLTFYLAGNALVDAGVVTFDGHDVSATWSPAGPFQSVTASVTASNDFTSTTTTFRIATSAPQPLTVTGTAGSPFFATASVSPLMTASVPLPSYFSDPQGGALTFYLLNDPLGGATTIDPSTHALNLVWAPLASSNATVSVGVAASNLALNLGAAGAVSVSVAAVQPPVLSQSRLSNVVVGSLSNVPITYDLAEFLSDPQFLPLTYSISNNPFASASVAGHVLTVRPSFRNATYAVGVTATDSFGLAVSDALTVTEGVAPSPSVANGVPRAVTLSNATAAFGLSNFFSDPLGCNLAYSVAPTAYNNATIVGDVLYVAGSWIGATPTTYAVVVVASNAAFGVATTQAVLQVTEAATQAPHAGTSTLASIAGLVLSNAQVADFALSDYFVDPQGSAMTYWVASNAKPGSAAILGNSNLRLVGAFRAASNYAVTVAASNAFGQYFAETLTVTEPTPVAPVQTPAVVQHAFPPPSGGKLTGPTSAFAGQAYGNGAYVVTQSDYLAGTSPAYASVCGAAPAAYRFSPAFTSLGAVTASNAQSFSVAGLSNLYFPKDPTLGAAGPMRYYLASNGSGFPGSASVAGNALSVRPFFSGKTYGVTAAASNAECLETNTLTVTELAPAAIGAATVSNATPVRFGLSNSVADYGGQPTYYWLTANPNGNASIAAGGVLGVTGFYRGATYAVTVAASNSAGQVSAPTTLTVTEPAAGAPTVAATFATMTLTNNSSNVALATSAFSDPQGSTLYYWLSGNPKGNATLVGSTLSVSGFYRGATYNVSVSASNVYGKTSTGALAVTEPAAAYPIVAATFASISVTNNTSNVALATYFSDPQGSALYYWVSANPQLNATIAGSTLSVAGNYRGAAYNVGVSASNVYGLSITGSVAVTEPNPVPALSGVTLPITAIGTNTATFAAATAFTVTSAVTYTVTANPFSNATINATTGALSVVGNNRGVGPYVVTVAATNASGTASTSVTIVEPPVSSGLLAMYMGESWNTGGVAGWRDMFGTNHATATTGTVAQTAASLNGRTVLSGAASPVAASIQFPSAVLPSTYTLFTLCRYTGTNKGRIVASTTSAIAQNWLSGHWNGCSGVAVHGNSWMTPNTDAGSGSGWVLSSDQNGLYRYNGNTRSTGSSAGSPSYISGIGINVLAAEPSDWACACTVVFTGTLTAPQIQAVEAWLSSMYALTVTVSPSFVTPSSLTSAYSMRRYVGGYAGAIVTVRRAYDNATSDFYTDSVQTGGELWTGATVGQGTSLTAWLSGSTASVVKWYDQSGNNNHAYNYQTFPTTQYQTPRTQYEFFGAGGTTVASSQPTLVRHCGYWTMRFRMACSSTLFLTTNIQPNTVVAQLNNVNSGTLVASTGGLDQRMYQSAILSGNNGDWYACAGGTKLASFNGATLSANPSVNAWWSSVVLSSSAPATTAATYGSTTATSFDRIGTDGYYPSLRGLDGYLSEICFHNTALNAADASAIYLERFAPFVPATFPPAAMTAAQTTFAASSGRGARWSTDGGIYAATSSSVYTYSGDPNNYSGWIAFAPGTGAGTDNGWLVSTGGYSGTGGLYAGSFTTSAMTGGWLGNGCTLGGWVGLPGSATSYAGEWLQLKCPQTMLLTGYSITGPGSFPTRSPGAFALLGSANGGTTWIALDVRTGVTGWTANQAKSFVPNQAVNHACSTFRLVVQQTTGSAYASVYSLQLQGYPQSGADGVVCGGQTLWLDATNSTGATYTNASPIYSYDMSGNGNSFNLYNLSYTPVTSAPYASYYNWEQGTQQMLRFPTGSATYNVPFAAGVNTLVAVMKWSAGTGDYRTLCRDYGNTDVQVCIPNGSQSMGMFYNYGSSGFLGCDTPVVMGTTAGTTTAFTSYNLMVWKLSTTAPYYRVYMNPASTATALTPVGQIATNANAALTAGIGMIGGQPANGTQCPGDVAEFFWFPRELSDAELVQLFYYYQPIYSLGVPTMLSSGAGCCGLYSLKTLNGANGAVVNCRRSSDGATTDAYYVAGTLCTSASGSATLTSWLGAATAYVVTWYDQSGSANHATMSTASQQPTLDAATLRVVFTGAQYLSMPNGTIPSGNAQYTITARHGPISNSGAHGIWGSGSYSSTDGTLALDTESGTYNNYWFGDDIFGTNGAASTAGENVVTCRYDQSTRYMYINTALASTKANVNARNSSSANNTLGVTQNYSFFLNSYLDYVAIFSYSMGDSSRVAVETLWGVQDGSSAANAGASAAAIKALTGTNTNGVYWIDLPTVGATQIYCIMDSAVSGGGWMMALKTAASGTTFSYASSHWTSGTSTLSPSDTTRNAGDAKYETFNRFASTDIMAIWPDIPYSGGTITLPSGTYGNVWCWLKTSYNAGTAQTLSSIFSTANNLLFAPQSPANSFPRYPEAGNSTINNVFSQEYPASVYGININKMATMNVRFGMLYNEDTYDFTSCDCFGGIGLDTRSGVQSGDQSYWSAASSVVGINRGARAEVYIR